MFQIYILRLIMLCIIHNYLTYIVSAYNGSDIFRGEEDLDIADCIERLSNSSTTPWEFVNCCLPRICPLERTQIAGKMYQREAIQAICKKKLYLTKQSAGCRFQNNSQQNEVHSDKLIVRNKDKFDDVQLFNPPRALAQTNQKAAEFMAGTTAIPISLEQQKVKEPTNDNLTRRTTQNSGLQFLDIPKGDDLKIHELQLENEFLLFEAFSSLMGYLLPSEFPIDVFREAFKHTKSLHLWIFQVVKLEILVAVWIIFWAILSLCLPVGVMASFCFPTNIRRLNEEFSNESLDGMGRRTENTLGCLLHVLLIIMLCPVILILASNEQISRSISKAPVIAAGIYEDMNTFIRNSHMQISFVSTSSTDITIEEIRKDLVDIDVYLGVPYQQQLSSETRLDVVLVDLEELKEKTSKVSSIVSDLLIECESARKASKALQDEIQDVARQVVTIQQQCSVKDRPLCFTIQVSGFDVSLPLNNITNDANIQQLNRMNKEEAFNTSIELSRKTYSAIPEQVVQESIPYISDIKSLLSRKRTEVYKSTHDLDILARTLSQRVSASQEAIFILLENVVKWDLWRWLAILVTAAIISLIWGFLICGAPCGCGVTSKTIPLLMSGIVLSCLICLLVWAIGTVSLLLGGHGQSLICHPLYDHPHYEILSEFLDSGGIFYGENGFFEEFSNENSSVKVANILKGCQRDQPVYHTFHLKNKIQLERNFNYRTWEDLNMLFNKFATAQFRVEILSPGLQLNLQVLASNTATNFTSYRHQLSSAITRRDLGSFADQLNTVGRQLADPVISRKVDNLAFSVRKVVQNEMQRLNDLRGRILYKITTLEVLLPPLNRQVNQSLSNLKTIQFSMDNRGWEISERVKRQFIVRIENYLQKLYDHVTRKVTKEIGKCRPIWDMFHAARFHICKLIFDPLNAIAFASYFLILILIANTPIVVKLIDFYNDTHEDSLFTSISHRESQEGLIIDEDRVWTSSSTESPPDEREMASHIPSAWVSPPPRPPTISSGVPVTRIPPPPAITYSRQSPRPRRKLSALASRITGARNLAQQIPSVSGTRNPRRGHESLKLIEPIHWKSGSTTPRSWI